MAKFTKPLVAGVRGSVKEIGLTILPLFDFVITDSSASFEASYCKIGQIPEGFSVMNLSNKIPQSLVSFSRTQKFDYFFFN